MFVRKGVPGVTWQDELQKLDNELASGRISADDYRRRRDEVLSGSAGGGPAQSPQQAPFAPPFKWEAQPPSASGADATQVVPNQMPPKQQPPQNHNPDATQVVNTQQRSNDSDRTQFVAPVAPQPGPGWGPGPQQQAAPPPWVGGDFDSINSPSPGWSHGPEVFDETGGKGGKGKVIGIVLVVVLLAGLGFGAYWLWGRGTGDPNAGGQTDTPTSTSTKPSAPPDPLPAGKLPGKVAENKQVKDFTPVPTLKYLLDNEILSYNSAGAGKTKLVQFTLDNGSKGILLIVQAKDAAAAKNAAKELHDIQINNGMTEATNAPNGVLVGTVDAKGGEDARVRGHYSSKDLIVRLDVTSKTLASAQKDFKDSLDAELKVLSADE
jgi:hypothetical protein